jgi:hypothetical protein
MAQLSRKSPEEVALFMQFFCSECQLEMKIQGCIIYCVNQKCRARTSLYHFHVQIDKIDPVGDDLLSLSNTGMVM